MPLDSRFTPITEKIIGCALRVHGKMGSGFQEVIYQRCLAIEMEKAQLLFAREVEMPLFYDGHEVGARRVDFLVEESVLVELKALTEINDSHYAQVINYLNAYELEVGLLLNFGEPSLRIKRFVKSQQSRKTNHSPQQ
ncbi:GxxExxY protein [Hymenobacter weizhouensis]|uniref:GxxExxY protein n=1 Tax=Hymenobacter sp. YIM 151500-1 TaxID=2987689 RepID=UPI002225D947|nr:GxxExxY protein [Hymenobacter sp. YIM 151500-1]UYZ62137.1 GxxExxY protein [Hymenobacter sp. YIM 151500-1]